MEESLLIKPKSRLIAGVLVWLFRTIFDNELDLEQVIGEIQTLPAVFKTILLL